MEISQSAARIAQIIEAEGGSAWITGGACRDHFMGKAARDFDIEAFGIDKQQVVDAMRAAGIAAKIAGAAYAIVIAKIGGDDIEISVSQGTVAEAAARRDFSMNAMYFRPATSEWADPFGGRQDIEAGVIRATPGFPNDPTRMMRAARFAARFGFEIEPATAEMIRAMAGRMSEIAIERIWPEFAKAFEADRPGDFIRAMAEIGIIGFWPEIASMIGCPQEPEWHPEGWSISEISDGSYMASPAQAVTANAGCGQFVFTPAAGNAFQEAATATREAQPVVDRAFRRFPAASCAWPDFSFVAPEGSEAVITESVRFMQPSFSAPGANERVRIMFQVPGISMRSIMQPAVNNFEIIRQIIRPIAIFVMNVFRAQQRTAQHEFRNDAMDANRATFTGPAHIHVTSITHDASSDSVDRDPFCSFDFSFGGDSNHVSDFITTGRIFQVRIGDAFQHTAYVMDAAAAICRRDGITGDDRIAFIAGAMIHDCGKPETTVTRDDGRIASPAHAEVGAGIAAEFFSRCGIATSPIANRAIAMTAEHMAHANEISPRTVRRIAARAATRGASIMDIARIIEADASGRPPMPAGMPEGGRRMIEIAQGMSITESGPAPIIMGRHIMAMGIEPGPRIGRICKAAFEAQIEGAFADEAGGIAWASAAAPGIM